MADDDIIYPHNYVERLKEAIDEHKCIITFHGRELKSTSKYYRGGHLVWHYKQAQKKDIIVDVAGTGVCGFRTDYFNPIELYKSRFQKMSDLVFSLEAKRQSKKIICLNHTRNWLKSVSLKNDKGIFHEFYNKNESQQVELMREIIRLKQ